ncbi:MAG: InlB B-repeat-containing protein, partial [Roseburia sp.]|nr:InlB B-repeat-containing protein [Roseburia sp.]
TFAYQWTWPEAGPVAGGDAVTTLYGESGKVETIQKPINVKTATGTLRQEVKYAPSTTLNVLQGEDSYPLPGSQYYAKDNNGSVTGVYTFSGWTAYNEKGEVLADAYQPDAETGSFTMAPNNTVFQGEWTYEALYTVTYDLDGGTVAEDVELVYDGLHAGDETPAIANPTKTGYTFKGWTPDWSETVTGDVTYTANFELKKYTVNYDWGYAEGEADKMGEPLTDVTWSQTALLPAADPERTGYTFAGWTLDGESVSADAAYSTLAGEDDTKESVTLVATWAITVTITGTQASLPYNGSEQKVTGFSSDAPADVTVALKTAGKDTAKGTNVGTYKMKLTEDDFTVAAHNASVTVVVVDGYVTISAVDEVIVTITGHKDTVTYDGAEHTVSGYDVKISNALYTEDDFAFTGTASVTQTNAGTYPMGLKAEQFSNENGNFAKVTFNVTDGALTIEKKAIEVTVTGNNATATYDGKAHAATGFTTNAPEGVTVSLAAEKTAHAERTAVGTSNMGLTKDSFVVESANYAVTISAVVDGYVTISAVDEVIVTI